MRDVQTADAVPHGASSSKSPARSRNHLALALCAILVAGYAASLVGAANQAAPAATHVGAVNQAAPAASPPVQPRAPAQPAAATVTGQRCIRCHREVVSSFGEAAHGKAAAFLKDSRNVTCETCHGDGAKHIESAEPKDIASPPKMPVAQVNATCLTCHANSRKHLQWRGSAHDRQDMSCTSCHSDHHPKSAAKMLVTRTEQDLCISCHTERRKAIFQRSTHLFRTDHKDAKMECSSCHNPHGGEGKAMLQAASTNKLCYSCHADKRGPFLWEHAPVRENCLVCHDPHGSNQQQLLKTRSTQLCQSCHINMLWRHQTVAGHDVFTFNKGCQNCHSQVHGSNHPSGKTFTR